MFFMVQPRFCPFFCFHTCASRFPLCIFQGWNPPSQMHALLWHQSFICWTKPRDKQKVHLTSGGLFDSSRRSSLVEWYLCSPLSRLCNSDQSSLGPSVRRAAHRQLTASDSPSAPQGRLGAVMDTSGFRRKGARCGVPTWNLHLLQVPWDDSVRRSRDQGGAQAS